MWVPNKKISSGIHRFLGKFKGCTELYHTRKEDIINQLQIYSTHAKIKQCRSNCIQHLNLVDEGTLSKLPHGHRDTGREQLMSIGNRYFV